MKSYQSLPMRLDFFVKLKYQSKGTIPWPERRIMTHLALGCVNLRPKMRPVAVSKRPKRTETFMRQTGYLSRPPTSMYPPEILHAGSSPESSYIFQVSWKSVQGSQSCGGSKIALSHWLGPWLIQQLVRDTLILPYSNCSYKHRNWWRHKL